MAGKKKKPQENVDGLKLFGGKTPKDIRKLLGIPADFKITGFMGVPIDKIPYRYLLVFTEGLAFEGRVMRSKIETAMRMDDELKQAAAQKAEPEAPAADNAK